MTYEEFLKEKIITAPDTGFDVPRGEIHPALKPHQADGVRWALHVCPLQLDIVERVIHRYSNPGEWVGDCFAGLMSVPSTAVKMGRYGWGCELNTDYFRDGVGYLEAAQAERDMPTLFDLLEDGA